MTFFPLPALNDNYIWITENSEQKKIWAVDPGDASVVKDYCQNHGVTLAGIILTHHHWDHTDGVPELRNSYDCPVYGPESLAPDKVTVPVRQGDTITINQVELMAIATPGHTLDHLCYFGEPEHDAPILLCGDTLFRGGCGRLFEGSPAQMLNAMTRLRELPGDTRVYGTHEYTLANYRFAKAIDPDNQALEKADQDAQALRQDQQVTLPSTIALEVQTNPFFRFDVPHVIDHAAQLLNETPASDLVSAFAQIRRAKDGF
ncbi:hydroxyacylglutathione hydrolase [Marinomonas ostreistagni]|uniref:hydroxyacylglutathione hydrolase n=1 Tax=Marinomonas ostreistagni TaxID=359209 RepID=UPI00194EA998|nr:hydroxyacylglutathione hydrolase [Marinomonas ostreistagni]MBM6551912.1 hydroxyacylglutathione hydrolase [Marinomonas ostreistagni]